MTKLEVLEAKESADYSSQIAVLEEKVSALENIDTSHEHEQEEHTHTNSLINKKEINFEAIVVGGGHAGTEAATAISRMGHRTLLLTHSKNTIGQMSCNPAIGGVGKGHLAKEVDAMGGLIARAADLAGIHIKKLNSSKGKAVQATRAQADRELYRAAIQKMVLNQEKLTVKEGSATRLIIERDKIIGLETERGERLYTAKLVLTVGTFLNGVMHTGESQTSGGRKGDAPSVDLGEQLLELMPRTGRLKTGTPPRLLKESIDFKKIDKDFILTDFLTGARDAYEMILLAFKRGDITEVEKFISSDVEKAFSSDIDRRKSEQLMTEATFGGIRELTILDADIDDKSLEAEITIRFLSDLTIVVKNQSNEGEVKGYWTGKKGASFGGQILPCIHKDIDSKNLI